MITREDIQLTCDDIVREFAPLQVILFGSYAYGAPTEDSDIDLLVVMEIPESETRRQAVEIRQRIPRRFPMTCLYVHQKRLLIAFRISTGFFAKLLKKVRCFMGATIFFKTFEKREMSYESINIGMDTEAEGEYTTVKLLQESPISSKDVICFHAQQCIEKYLKAWLQEAHIPFSKYMI